MREGDPSERARERRQKDCANLGDGLAGCRSPTGRGVFVFLEEKEKKEGMGSIESAHAKGAYMQSLERKGELD